MTGESLAIDMQSQQSCVHSWKKKKKKSIKLQRTKTKKRKQIEEKKFGNFLIAELIFHTLEQIKTALQNVLVHSLKIFWNILSDFYTFNIF